MLKHPFRLALIILVVLAAIPRLLTYDFSLPYIDYPDEPTLYLTALHWRDILPSPPPNAVGYPPGSIALHVLLQWVLKPFIQVNTHVSAMIEAMRLVSVGFNLLTLAFIMLTTRRIGGTYAALIAGATWAASPILLENGVFALADPGAIFFMVFSVWLAVVALQDEQRRHWCIWSVIVGLLAMLFKYPVAPTISAGGAVALWIAWRQPRQGIRYLVIQGALTISTVLALWFLNDVPEFLESTGKVVSQNTDASTLENMLNPVLVLNNLYYSLYISNATLFGVLMAGGLIAYGLSYYRKLPHLDLGAFGVVALAGFTLVWLSAGFVEVTETYRLRDVFPPAVLAYILLGASLAQILLTLEALLKISSAHRLMLQTGVFLGLLVIFLPQLQDQQKIIGDRTRPDRRNQLTAWIDTTLPSGAYISDGANHKTFNSGWGGYRGRHSYFHYSNTPLVWRPIEEWRAEGVQYAIMPYRDAALLPAEYLDDLLLIKVYPPSDAYRGPAMAVFRLLPMQYAASGQIGGVHLVGYDLDRMQLRAGESLTFTLYWQAESTPPDNYTVYNHLIAVETGQLVAQVDGLPYDEREFYRPTTTWKDPQETLISRPFVLAISEAVPPGEYRLVTGFYQRETGVRLLAPDGEDHIEVTIIEVIE